MCMPGSPGRTPKHPCTGSPAATTSTSSTPTRRRSRPRSRRRRHRQRHPLADAAVAFGQWNAARRLIERGAQANLSQAAALGLIEQVRVFFDTDDEPSADEITGALWCACPGGQQQTTEYLLDRCGDLNWIGYDKLTPSTPPGAAAPTSSPPGWPNAARRPPTARAYRAIVPT